MDFRSIRVDDVSFEPIKNARNGLRYGGNTSLKFQVPRLRYRISANPHGSMTLTPTSVIFPNEFDAFVSSLVEKSGVTCTHPFERIATTNDTIMFDSHERVMDTDPRPGSVIDASIMVSIKGTWTNGVISGLCMDVDQIKIYSMQEPDTTPRVYIDGTLI